MGLNLVSKSAKEIQEGFSEIAIETPDNSVPRTSATRVSPFVMEQAAKARGQSWRQRTMVGTRLSVKFAF